MFAFGDEEQRVRWSNFPISIVPRAGVAMKDMTPAQPSAAMNLLGAALQAAIEEAASQEAAFMFGKDLGYSFGGHHLAVNVTIAGERGILSRP